jgi:UDPglucose--hexose-1-phosphate uridylyltransferase
MLQITSPQRAADKLKYLAGSEAAMGAWIGDIPPELSAQKLREAMGRADERNPVGQLPKGIEGLESAAMANAKKSSRAEVNGNLRN